MVDRVDLINEIVIKKNVKSYLEIGVFGGECLFNVKAPKKVAVDPKFSFGLRHKAINYLKNYNYNIQFHEIPSDNFFETNEQMFDLIFIDGLHTWQQLLIDIENSLKFISPNGLILMHDCLPLTKWEALPAKSYEDFKQSKPDDVSPLWCGDGWKVLFDIKKQITDLELEVVDMDHGIGVIKNGENGSKQLLSLSKEKTNSYDYDQHFEDFKRTIDIVSPQKFMESV